MTLEKAAALLKGLTPIAAAIPVLGTAVEGALEVTSQIIKYAQEVKNNKERTRDLAEQAAGWLTTITRTLDDLKDDGLRIEKVRDDVVGVFEILDEIAITTHRRTKESWVQRARHKSDDKEELDKLTRRLELAFEKFMASSQMRIEAVVDNLMTTADLETLRKLNPIGEARYDAHGSPTGCLQATRIDVLAQILRWVNEPSETLKVYWLAGLAGTGKSTIAKTFCEMLIAQDVAWVCTFFVSKNSGDRRDAFRIVHTLAFELAQLYPAFRSPLLNAIQAPPEIKTRSMREQVQRLLQEPLHQARKRSGDNRPVVFVIDALDECEKMDGMEGGTLIPELASAFKLSPVKVIITSRMERSLTKMFKSLPHDSLKLHEIAEANVSADIRRVWHQGFVDIIRDHDLSGIIASEPPSAWPNPDDIEELVNRTGQLFIFATTALKYIGDERAANPTARLRYILDHTTGQLMGSSMYARLDELYTGILRTAMQDIDQVFCDRLFYVLGTVVVYRGGGPLYIGDLARLLGLSQEEVYADLHALAAVLLITPHETRDSMPDLSEIEWSLSSTSRESVSIAPDVAVQGLPAESAWEPDMVNSVQVFHPSFRDFLIDRLDNKSAGFPHTSKAHAALSLRCLSILNDSSAIRSHYGLFLSGAHALKTAQCHITNYALSFWAEHFWLSGEPSESLTQAVCSFILRHLPYSLPHRWVVKTIDTLPALMTVCSDSSAIPSTLRLSGVQHRPYASPKDHFDHSLRCLSLLSDSLRVDVCHIKDPSISLKNVKHSAAQFIEHTSEQLRYACLYWAVHLIQSGTWQSEKSLFIVMLKDFIRCHFFEWLEMLSVMGLLREFTSSMFRRLLEVGLLQGGCEIQAVTSSIKFARQLIGQYEYIVVSRPLQVYYSMLPMAAHMGADKASQPLGVPSLLSVNLHSWEDHGVLDGCPVIAVDANTICFSPDGSSLVSSSNENVLRLWDVRTGLELCFFPGHSHDVVSVTFSPNGTFLASGSADRTVRVWDCRTGLELVNFQGHSGTVQSVAFSSAQDSRLLVSGAVDTTLRLWDVIARHHVLTLAGHSDEVTSVSFSPNGQRIISGSKDTTLRLWDAQTGAAISVFRGHSAMVSTVAISCDGVHIVSTSHDNTMRLWDIGTSEDIAVIVDLDRANPKSAHPITEYMIIQQVDSGFLSAAFSPKGDFIVSGSSRGDCHIWNAHTRICELSFYGHDSQSKYPLNGIDVKSVAWSPDGRQIATMTSDATIRLWDARTGHPYNFTGGHLDAVVSLSFSPRGDFLVSASRDGTIRVWTICEDGPSSRGSQLTSATWEGDRTKVGSIAFTDKGRDIKLTMNDGGEITRWTCAELGMYEDLQDHSEQEEDPEPWSIPVKPNAIRLGKKGGWVEFHRTESALQDTGLRLCWLPKRLRGGASASHGTIFAISASDGHMTIMDFAPTIKLFRDLGKLD